MPDLKPLGRQIAQPTAPDIRGAAEPFAALGKIMTEVAKTAGEYVDANNTLIEKSILATAATDFETSYINYKNDPNITQESLINFQQELQTKSDALLETMPSTKVKSATGNLGNLVRQYSNKALNDTIQQGQKNEIRDANLSIHELTSIYAQQISTGDFGGAIETKTNLSEMLQSLIRLGATPEKIISISEDVEILGLTAEANSKLKSAKTEDERTRIVQDLASRPDTPVNIKAFNNVYKEYGRLNKLYKEGLDISDSYKNSIDGNAYKNRDLSSKEADALNGVYLKNITANNPQPPDGPSTRPKYQAMPLYAGQNKTYDYEEELAAEKEGRPQNLYLVESYVQTQEAPVQREPNLFELAQAHAWVGSKNQSRFPQTVSDILFGGPGDSVKDAITSINYVYEKNPNSLDLDEKTSMLYTIMESAIRTGRTDYDKIAEDAREVVLKKGPSNIKINESIFNASYSLSGKGQLNLNKAFKSAFGVNAIETGSTMALETFYDILRSRTILADGNTDVALEDTKRQMLRTFGKDNFTGDRFVAFPPSLTLQGQNDVQIANQFLTQIVAFADKNDTIKLPERYQRIKTADDYDRANVDYRTLAKVQTGGNKKHSPLLFANPIGIEITQYVEGEGSLTGQLFVKPNELTAQNNSGMPVWEAWMRVGDREFPIIDNSSPSKNIFLLFGKGLDRFAPQYTKDQSDDEIKKVAQEVLEAEGRQLYGFSSYIPLTTARKLKQSYIKDLGNIERVEEKVKKVIGKEESE